MSFSLFVFEQVALELSSMILFIAEQLDDEVLRDVVKPFTELYDFVVLRNRAFFRLNHSLDDADNVSRILHRLKKRLVASKSVRARNDAAKRLDAVGWLCFLETR
jgi:hypothetical protein